MKHSDDDDDDGGDAFVFVVLIFPSELHTRIDLEFMSFKDAHP